MNFRIFSRTNMIILILLSNEEITIKAGIPSDSVGVYINEGPKKSEIYDEKGGKISIPLFRQVSSNFGMLALFSKIWIRKKSS